MMCWMHNSFYVSWAATASRFLNCRVGLHCRVVDHNASLWSYVVMEMGMNGRIFSIWWRLIRNSAWVERQSIHKHLQRIEFKCSSHFNSLVPFTSLCIILHWCEKALEYNLIFFYFMCDAVNIKSIHCVYEHQGNTVVWKSLSHLWKWYAKLFITAESTWNINIIKMKNEQLNNKLWLDVCVSLSSSKTLLKKASYLLLLSSSNFI